jgi:hypothetical protein
MEKFITPLALKGTPVTIYQAQMLFEKLYRDR